MSSEHILKNHLFSAALALSALLLAGCTMRQPLPEPTPSPEPTPTVYTVRYTVRGEPYAKLTVTEGECPAAVEPSIDGLRFDAWTDESGSIAEPEMVAVYSDLIYDALIFPELGEHAAYLFTDENGRLYPDDALTGEMLSAALSALASPGAADYFPALPEAESEIEPGMLRTVLSCFFDGEAVEAVCAGLGESGVRRAEFAAVMNALLGRGGEETVMPAEGAELPKDLLLPRDDLAALLEASIPHTADSAGTLWADSGLIFTHEPGYFNLDGWLYCMGEDGVLLADGETDGLHFGPNGRYTCGDAELDELVAGILAGIIDENPDADRLDILRKAFEYCRDTFTYLRKNAYSVGQTGWEINDAKVMLTGLRGNCYNYAASFWALARGLGYPARAISGTILPDYQPHGWVEITLDGVTYTFDAEMEMTYDLRNRPEIDMFMMTPAYAAGWTYRK